MKARTYWLNAGQVFMALLTLSGCTSPGIKPKDATGRATFSALPPVAAATETATALATFPPNPTPVPTELHSQEILMVGLLQGDDCRLPCYLGIMPGKTTLGEARIALEGIGAYHTMDVLRKDGSIDYGYSLWIGDPSGMNETPDPDGSTVTIYEDLDLVSRSGLVEGLEVYVNASKSMSKFRQYWSRYSARGIFLQMGAPDHLYVDNVDPRYLFYGRRLLIVYEEHSHAVIELYGTGQENAICPANEARFIDLNMRLYDPRSSLSVYSAGGAPSTNRLVWLPVEEVLGVNASEFYSEVLANPSRCFEPK